MVRKLKVLARHRATSIRMEKTVSNPQDGALLEAGFDRKPRLSINDRALVLRDEPGKSIDRSRRCGMRPCARILLRHSDCRRNLFRFTPDFGAPRSRHLVAFAQDSCHWMALLTHHHRRAVIAAFRGTRISVTGSQREQQNGDQKFHVVSL